MNENTAVRNLPPGTKQKYRDMAAKRTKGAKLTVSMNSLYVKALIEYLAKRAGTV